MANPKGNPQNLINIKKLTPKQRQEMARKGGKASAEKRKNDKLMRDGFAFLEHLKAFSLFRIVEDKDGYYLRDTMGYVMEYEQVKDICEGLINFAEKHKGKLIRLNDETEEKYVKITNREYISNKQPEDSIRSHVYLMECGGKYKIGVSKNVSQRMKQLDTRPFELKLVAKSKLLNNAYELEGRLHKMYEKERISGEWFSLDQSQVRNIKDFLEIL